MPSNIRSKPIYGTITDSAGNITRDSNVSVKLLTPTEVVEVDSTRTNDNGEFTTKPLPNGKYAIYCSGLLNQITDVISVPSVIPCYKPNEDNIPGLSLFSFEQLRYSGDINDYKVPLQIEDESVDVVTFGSSFPIHQMSDLSDKKLKDWIPDMYNALYLNEESKLTYTRFDVEYYIPVTSEENIHKRVRWSGVPAIRYRDDLKLVVVLDYYALTVSMPKISSNTGGRYTYISTSNSMSVEIPPNKSIMNGDIVKLTINSAGDVWYGIVIEALGSTGTILLTEWKAKRDENYSNIASGNSYISYDVFDGMYSGMNNISGKANERFSIVENVEAQNIEGFKYKY